MKYEKAVLGKGFSLADGVSCESCHGPAERWLTVHYQAGFKEKSVEEKASTGQMSDDARWRQHVFSSLTV